MHGVVQVAEEARRDRQRNAGQGSVGAEPCMRLTTNKLEWPRYRLLINKLHFGRLAQTPAMRLHTCSFAHR